MNYVKEERTMYSMVMQTARTYYAIAWHQLGWKPITVLASKMALMQNKCSAFRHIVGAYKAIPIQHERWKISSFIWIRP